jgi:hypothetical protein
MIDPFNYLYPWHHTYQFRVDSGAGGTQLEEKLTEITDL